MEIHTRKLLYLLKKHSDYLCLSAGLYRRDILQTTIYPFRKNRNKYLRESSGSAQGLERKKKQLHNITLFLYQTKYLEAKRSVYTKEGGHFGGLLTRAGGITYSTVFPVVHFRHSSGPGREGVELNQRCPPSCKAQRPTLDHKK